MNLSLISANQKTVLPTWISRGIKISQSCHHKDLFILNYPDGGFVTISSSQEAMQRLHPKDIVEIFREHEQFKFNHTSNYVASKQPKEKWQKEKKFTSRLN